MHGDQCPSSCVFVHFVVVLLLTKHYSFPFNELLFVAMHVYGEKATHVLLFQENAGNISFTVGPLREHIVHSIYIALNTFTPTTWKVYFMSILLSSQFILWNNHLKISSDYNHTWFTEVRLLQPSYTTLMYITIDSQSYYLV